MSIFLHPSPHETVLPHLTPHLPRSLPVWGSISHSSPSSPIPCWASFPPSTPPNKVPSLFTVTTSLQPPHSHQLRFFCSVESRLEDLTPAEMDAAKALVKKSVEGLKEQGVEVFIGGLWEGWREGLGGWREGGWHPYGVWLAPEGTVMGELEVAEGAVIRNGEPGDIDAMTSTSEIKRTREYIQSRLSTASVATIPTSPNPNLAVSWALTVPDTSIGTLYTSPHHRKKGLAKLVVQHRLREAGGRGFCYVKTGNEGSEGLWKSLGWTREWITVWVNC
ncbi:hypothetical protein MNV49_001241 [Pseudohyphozyma bogoriensis]|nr:hypothetical protein MNV49_001241 [Pseudohyphozyma bogoriensis]